ncbi:HAMP domain-containing histidine kinase [bacterium]|nr:HAMP domain-containing histidine kinase [bacterium]
MLNFLFNGSNKFKNNFDSYPDAIVIINKFGDIVYSNKRFHSVFALNETYQPVNNINDLLDKFVLPLNDVNTVFPLTGVVKYTLNNDFAYLEYSVNKEEKNEEFTVTFRDITENYTQKIELENSYEQTQKLNKNKNNFLVKITPDINLPLQSVFSFSQALLEGLGGELTEKQEKYAKIIWKNAKEISNLMDKILLLTKIEADNFAYEFKNIDFISTLKQVKNDYKQFFAEKNLDFIIDYSQLAKRQCVSDEKALKIIFANFVESALTSTDIGSVKITVKTPQGETLNEQGYSANENKTVEDFIQFTIEDTGNGFTPEEFEVLFNPYEEVEMGNKKNLSRSLGLAVTKHLVEAVGGRIWGKSSPLNGSEFNFIIPTTLDK